jgi:hypothetical protein
MTSTPNPDAGVPTTYEVLQRGYTEDLWYDWFCKDEQLQKRGQRLFARLQSLALSPRFSLMQTTVWFKNNAPLVGGTYDDFRLRELGTTDGRVLYTITPRSSHSKKAEVWGRENNFEEPIVSGTWKDVKAFFATKRDDITVAP